MSHQSNLGCRLVVITNPDLALVWRIRVTLWKKDEGASMKWTSCSIPPKSSHLQMRVNKAMLAPLPNHTRRLISSRNRVLHCRPYLAKPVQSLTRGLTGSLTGSLTVRVRLTCTRLTLVRYTFTSRYRAREELVRSKTGQKHEDSPI